MLFQTKIYDRLKSGHCNKYFLKMSWIYMVFLWIVLGRPSNSHFKSRPRIRLTKANDSMVSSMVLLIFVLLIRKVVLMVFFKFCDF